MRTLALLGALLAATVVGLATGHGQSTTNPDISVIPRFRAVTDDGAKLDRGIREFSTPDFQFEELEMAISSYLNPFSRADVILTLPGPDVENGKLGIEEAYASIVRGLPLDLNLRIGKYRAEFGKLNLMHPHAWPFITQPLSQERFFGEEGLNDLGVSASVLLPTGDVYSKLTLDVLRGSSIAGAAGREDTTGAKPAYAFSGRLMGFFPLSEESDLELGVSGLTGIHDPYHNSRFWYLNGDLKYKWRPSAYTSLVVQGEYLLNRRDLVGPQDAAFAPVIAERGTGTLSTHGMYLYADFQFFKIYSVGARFDWTESPYSSLDRARAVAVFLGYYPVEETLGVRLQYQNTLYDTPLLSRSVNMIAAQVLFSLGPHKAHPF